ncbi:MAG: hypothetical protein WBH35_00035 [Bacillota bacterium]|nr:hypothetical protein [Bacillota bacterium]HQD19093.1 hypothetical protein [Bacillota bacterium]
MLISELARLGRAYSGSGYGENPIEAIRRETSVDNPKVRKFFTNVFLIEICAEDCTSHRVVSHGCQRWGDVIERSTARGKTREEFVPDLRRAVSTAVKMITGGNPRAVVGRWPVPAYLMYAKDIDAIRSSKDAAVKFLSDRLAATEGVSLSENAVTEAAQLLVDDLRNTRFGGEKEQAGLVLLAIADSSGPYGYADSTKPGVSDIVSLGKSKLFPDKYLVARLSVIASLVQDAKIAEAGSKGSKRLGVCGVCGRRSTLTSPYCKSWPWLSYTWSCPLPASVSQQGGDPDLTDAIAGLCNSCLRSLLTGAAVVQKLERPMFTSLVKDIFSSYEGAAVQDQKRKQKTQLIQITGMMYVLPILDSWLSDPTRLNLYVSALNRMLQQQGPFSQREHLENILGFECVLPDEVSSDQYRLTILYYSGDRDRGDIYARAMVEDVLPSVARAVSNLLLSLTPVYDELSKTLFGKPQGDDFGLERSNMRFLPYLLARAYGSPYVFTSMQRILTGQPLDSSRFVRGCASRMGGIMVSASSDRRSSLLAQEVRFYILFREFLRRYHTSIAKRGDRGMPIESWVEFDERLQTTPSSELRFSDVEELGYAVGQAIRRFSNSYWVYMKKERKKDDSDFIRDRVMTFGTRLLPDTIWKRGLAMVEEYRVRLPKMSRYIDSWLRERVGVLLAEYSRMRDEVNARQDEFMAAFWSGYALGSKRKEATGDDGDEIDVLAELSDEGEEEVG